MIKILPFGSSAVLVELEKVQDTQRVAASCQGIGAEAIAGWGNVLITCRPGQTTQQLRTAIAQVVLKPIDVVGKHHIVSYIANGVDLAEVSAKCELSIDDLIQIFETPIYRVECLGFVRGFPYLSGLDSRLNTPRRPTPRQVVPSGSIAIAIDQTGIYPIESPGGWNLLGRTLEPIFNPQELPPTRFSVGDTVAFRQGSPRLLPAAPEHPTTVSEPAIEVVACSGFASIQDEGRLGHRSIGIGSSGAFDKTAYRLANRLVGNVAGAAVFECAFSDVTLIARSENIVAVTGAVCEISINGVSVDQHCATLLKPGDKLRVRRPTVGLRTYIALRGGLAVDKMLGSASFDSLAKLGPPQVISDMVLAVGEASRESQPWFESVPPRDVGETDVVVKVNPGPHADLLDENSITKLFSQTWTVDDRCDRVGIRLVGTPQPGLSGNLPSFALLPGSVQLPPDGYPIILGPDAGTTGGYPVIGVIENVAMLAQLRPGSQLKLNYLHSAGG